MRSRSPHGLELARDVESAALVREQGPSGTAWSELEERLTRVCLSRIGVDEASNLAVGEAVAWVRDVAVLGGRWDPELGATLAGTAVRRARLRLAHHRRGRRRLREVPVGVLDDPTSITRAHASVAGTDPGEIVAEWLDATAVLADRALATRIGAWQAAGWTLADAAVREGVSERSATTTLWRARQHWARMR